MSWSSAALQQASKSDSFCSSWPSAMHFFSHSSAVIFVGSLPHDAKGDQAQPGSEICQQHEQCSSQSESWTLLLSDHVAPKPSPHQTNECRRLSVSVQLGEWVGCFMLLLVIFKSEIVGHSSVRCWEVLTTVLHDRGTQTHTGSNPHAWLGQMANPGGARTLMAQCSPNTQENGKMQRRQPAKCSMGNGVSSTSMLVHDFRWHCRG